MHLKLIGLLTVGMILTVLSVVACSAANSEATHVASINELSTTALRERSYRSTIQVAEAPGIKPWRSYLASYDSDGLRVYTRVDIPDMPQPRQGYPVVIFLHGWTGIDRAPTYDLYFREHKDYDEMVDAYVAAGFVVFTPGWRGHGTVDGVPADGIEFVEAYDNGSYLSPVFYAIDILNLIDGLQTFREARLDLERINLSSHSQGGDVALITLAVAGEGSALRNEINAASIWSGTFPSRFTQVHTYHPMETSPDAFLSGDGSWTGTAVGSDGSVNPNFVFAYPSDWIETPDTGDWTWQKNQWSTTTVEQAVANKFGQMYATVNEYANDIDNAEFEIELLEDGSFRVLHDPRVESAMGKIGGFDLEEYLTEPLNLQHSDRDFYSLPAWNADLCQRINSGDGSCNNYEYAGNTHALRVSTREWFSNAQATPGFFFALQRDIALFMRHDPSRIVYP